MKHTSGAADGGIDDRRGARLRRVVLPGWLVLVAALSLAPVIAHHLPISRFVPPRDHILTLCVAALQALAAPVHTLFHLLLAFGFVYAMADRVQAVRRLRTAVSEPRPLGAPSDRPLIAAAHKAGVDPAAIRVATSAVQPFTGGLLFPRIFVSSALQQSLTGTELTAVLAHEDAHRLRRDPLRLSIWRFSGCLLFFAPAVRRLTRDMADELEIAADDFAVQRRGVQPLVLASALVEVAGRCTSAPALHHATAGFCRETLLERRVRRLAGEPIPARSHLTWRSTVAAAAVVATLWLTGIVVTIGSPQSPHGDDAGGAAVHATALPAHCTHHSSWALGHLFCLPAALADGALAPPAHAGDVCLHR